MFCRLAGLGTKVEAVSRPINTLEETIKLLGGHVKDRADTLSSHLEERSANRKEGKEVLRSLSYLLSLSTVEHLLGLRVRKCLNLAVKSQVISHLKDYDTSPDCNLTR